MKRTALFGAWAVTWTLGVGSGLVFVAGVLRDIRAGEPSIPVDLGRPTPWTADRFRPWRAGPRRLFISTVNHDSTHLGARFAGVLEIEVRDGSGQVVFGERYTGTVLDHTLPWNYGDRTLATVPVPSAPLRPWTLAVRIPEGDTRFAGAHTEITFWRERPDPGMGGLVNYVMMIPASLLLLSALALAARLATDGIRWPLVATAIPVAAGMVFSLLH